MTKRPPGLDDAYGLGTPADSRRLYADWAESYDSGFAEGMDYVLPRQVVRVFSDAGGRGPILDVGAGTGLVGAELAALGAGPVDGVDISPQMLDAARAKHIYGALIVADLTATLPMGDASYNGIISAGTFTTGHVGPDAIHELLRVAAPGARFALAIKEGHWTSAGFAEVFDGLGERIAQLQTVEVPIFGPRSDGPHAGDMALVTLFLKS